MDTDKRRFHVRISSPVFAKAVHITLASGSGRCRYSDNYFDLPPNTEKTILLETEKEVALEKLEKMLKVSSL